METLYAFWPEDCSSVPLGANPMSAASALAMKKHELAAARHKTIDTATLHLGDGTAVRVKLESPMTGALRSSARPSRVGPLA